MVDSWSQKGRSQLVSCWAKNCSLWARIYELVDEIGEDLISVVKVTAHARLRNDMCQYEKLCVEGNGFVDKAAKWGLDKHPSPENLFAFIKNLKVAYKAACKFMVSSGLQSFEITPKLVRRAKEFKDPWCRPHEPRHRVTFF